MNYTCIHGRSLLISLSRYSALLCLDEIHEDPIYAHLALSLSYVFFAVLSDFRGMLGVAS